MGAEYITVKKGFDYLHCDDLAAYLSEMAAKGWHFKMWNRGWMFEKGEPENATHQLTQAKNILESLRGDIVPPFWNNSIFDDPGRELLEKIEKRLEAMKKASG